MKRTRRFVILGLPAIALAGGTLLAYGDMKDTRDFLTEITAKIFGSEFAAEAVYRRFAEDHLDLIWRQDTGLKLMLYADLRGLPPSLVLRMSGAPVAQAGMALHQFKSLVATRFLRATNAQWRAEGTPVVYHGPQEERFYYCRNAFAQFDLES